MTHCNMSTTVVKRGSVIQELEMDPGTLGSNKVITWFMTAVHGAAIEINSSKEKDPTGRI